MPELREYQEKGTRDVAVKLSQGISPVIYQLATGGGKCLGVNTPVLMFDGTFKMVQDIKTGDLLMGIDSNPRKVLSTCAGVDNMYKVMPLKGEPFICNEPHVLSLKCNYSQYGFKKGNIYNIPLNEYLKLNKAKKHILKLYRCAGYEFPEKKTIIEPYLLGIWLGDGDSKGASLTNMDSEVLDYWYSYSAKTNQKIRVDDNKGSKAKIYHLSSNYRRDGFRSFLTKSGLRNNKHIPDLYKYNSKEKRLELLAGLIDTDGYLHHNGYEIFVKHNKLAEDIVYLCRSLGFYTKSVRKPGIDGNRITIYGEGVEFIPVKILRKKATKRTQIKDAQVTQFKVELIGLGDYFGFELDGDRLFIINHDLTVTHNTVTFATICKRYIEKSGNRVLILVHREELLQQTRRTLFDWYELNSFAITAGQKEIPHTYSVYVGMVETVHRRIEKPFYFPDFGLIIVDEAHLGNFKKVLAAYSNKLIIGFTATPISASKKDPLKNHFQDIVCGIDIPDLIKDKSLCQNETHRICSVMREGLSISMGEFDEGQMGAEYSKSKHVVNTVVGYESFLKGKKCIVFNCNIHHSELVTEAFLEAGYNCRHMDGGSDKQYRRECLQWLKNTPDAILCNVGVLTTGFDEPSLAGVIVNRSTMSLTLWLQMTGRAARPFPGKDKFIIVDMGDNALGGGLGDWSTPRDWNMLFMNPPAQKNKTGPSPVKECPKCGSLIPLQAQDCMYCGYIYPPKPPKEEVYDALPPEFELLIKDKDVADAIEKNKPYKEYYTFFQFGTFIAAQAKNRIKEKQMTGQQVDRLFLLYSEKAKEWCKLKNKKWNEWHRDTAKKHLTDQLIFNGFKLNNNA